MSTPVGQARRQARRDGRNNARHLLYSSFQRAVFADAAPAAGGKVTVGHLDAFELSVGMEHTSLDGAHFYTWARDAWIEWLSVELLRSAAVR